MREISLEDLTDEDRQELAEIGLSVIKAVSVATDALPCPACSAPVRKLRDNRDWSIECACGWSAAGCDAAVKN